MAGRHALFLVFDDAYARFARTCLNSIVRNWPGHPTILVAYTGSDATTRAHLAAYEGVRMLDPEEDRPEAAGHEICSVGSSMVYARWRMFSDRFDAWDMVLYLDVDLLVLAPLDDLLAEDRFRAVANHYPLPEGGVFKEGSADDPDLLARLSEDGLAYPGHPDDMLNSGVMAVPRRLRTADERAKLDRLAERYRAWTQYSDQSAASLWCLANGDRPEPLWDLNYQPHLWLFEDSTLPLKRIRVLHFSYLKPEDPQFRTWRPVKKRHRKIRRLWRRYAASP